MTLEELKGCLISHYIFAANGWRKAGDDSMAASFVIERDKPPSGYKIKVRPFGNCTIMNAIFRDGKYRTCFSVTQKQLVTAIRKLESTTQSKDAK